MNYARCVSGALALFVSSALLAGCLDENEAVIFVEPSIETPAANLAGSVLGKTVTGTFRLRLVLGPRASGASTVQIGSVNITDADGKSALVPSLSLMTSKPFPLTVEPGSDELLDVTFDMGDKTVTMEAEAALCAAPGVRISGTIEDSLQASATPFSSAVFAPVGCK